MDFLTLFIAVITGTGWLALVTRFIGRKEGLTLLIALVGASAWAAPWVFEKITKPKLEGRMICKVDNSGTFMNEPCLFYFTELNVVSLNKAFNIANVEVEVIYEDSTEPFSGHWCWMRPDTSQWVVREGDHEVKYRCAISPEDTLPYVGSLPKNETKTVYLLFRVYKAELKQIEKLTIKFIEQTGLVRNIVVNAIDLDPAKMVWDYRIWQRI